MGKAVFVSVVLLAVPCVGDSWARAWRVERDGSGDFAVIQDAVDAASAGDTIEMTGAVR